MTPVHVLPELDALEDEYRQGLITRAEYERRKNEISHRSLIY